MSVRLTNGTQRTTSYESIGHWFTVLKQKQEAYNFALTEVHNQIHRCYKELQEDFRTGQIDEATYRDFLKIICRALNNGFHEAVKMDVGEMEHEIEKMGISI